MPIACFVLVLALAALQRQTKLEHVEALLLKYKKLGLLRTPEIGFGGNESFQAVMKSAVDVLNGRYGRSVRGIQLNSFPVRDDLINMYFFEDDPELQLSNLRNNCAYVGSGNTIVCDLRLISNLLAVPNNYKYPETPEYLRKELGATLEDEQKSRDRNILYWIVLHELGHIAHGHGGRHFVSPGGTSHPGGEVLYELPATELPFPEEERQADFFLIETLRQWDEPIARSLAGVINAGFNSFIYHDMAKEAETQGLTGQSAREHHLKLRMPISASHPPLLVRAIRVNLLLVSEFGLEDPRFTSRFLKAIDIGVVK